MENIIIEAVVQNRWDKESFDIFRREALRSGRMSKEDLDIADAELLEKLDLVVDGKLKRAGVLCFYRKPEKVIMDVM